MNKLKECPHCSGEDHEYQEYEFDIETNTLRQIVECCDCGTQWNEVYDTVYTGIADVNVPLGPFDFDD
jgi:hypothetical protein